MSGKEAAAGGRRRLSSDGLRRREEGDPLEKGCAGTAGPRPDSTSRTLGSRAVSHVPSQPQFPPHSGALTRPNSSRPETTKKMLAQC